MKITDGRSEAHKSRSNPCRNLGSCIGANWIFVKETSNPSPLLYADSNYTPF